MTILPLLLALTGIITGIALSFIAPEELKPGWKYFKMARLGLFVLLTGLIGYSWWSLANFVSLGIFAAAAMVLFIINLKYRQRWLEIINYALFIIPYFLLSEQYQLLIASTLFIYGLPVGTLLWKMNYEKEI